MTRPGGDNWLESGTALFLQKLQEMHVPDVSLSGNKTDWLQGRVPRQKGKVESLKKTSSLLIQAIENVFLVDCF